MSDHLILIPVYNEAATIGDVVRRAKRHGDVLVVDDGSTDGVAAAASAAGADVVRLDRRRGKGAALRRGLAEAIARGADRIVTMDGDGQHDPDDIPRLLAAAAGAPEALVIGGRLGDSGNGAPRATDPVLPAGREAAIRVAGFFIDWLTGYALADTQSGFRVYPARLVEDVRPRAGGFVLESEMIVGAAARGWRLVEIPVRAIHFADRKSRFRPVRDGLAVGAYLAGRVVRRWGRDARVVAAALVRPFTAARRRPRHREMAEFTAPHRHHPAAWAAALGVFALDRTIATWHGWWRDPRARRMRVAAAASAATPALLGLALAAPVFRRLGRDPISGFVRRFYAHERLVGLEPATAAAPVATPGSRIEGGGVPVETSAPALAAGGPRRIADCDVVVIGGGPGGSAVATFLSRGGLSVALVERDAFPRFHIGESLLPANLPVLERLGVLDRVERHGFIVKHGASFHDQESGLEHTFYFRPGKPWPPYAFEVPRAEFDRILLEHAAAQPRVTLIQPAAVEAVAFDADGVTARIGGESGAGEVRARFLVDATGRDAFLASRHGQREPVPGLGKVALFAHFKGARRFAGRDEGNIRIYLFDGGWFWWIPFAGDTTSVGCVLHARTVRGRDGAIADLFDAMVERCERVGDGLAGASRVTPVHTAANFSYAASPVVGDRFVCVGDAVAFVDPIFSTGVFVAMQSAELASAAILDAFRDDRFEASRFARYERQVRRGVRPFLRFITSYYDPAFLDIFLTPKPVAGILDSVTGVLAGGTFMGIPLRMRMSLELFFAVVRVNRWRRGRRGGPVESRLEW